MESRSVFDSSDAVGVGVPTSISKKTIAAQLRQDTHYPSEGPGSSIVGAPTMGLLLYLFRMSARRHSTAGSLPRESKDRPRLLSSDVGAPTIGVRSSVSL